MTERDLALRRLQQSCTYWRRKCARLLRDVERAPEATRLRLAQAIASLRHKLAEADTKVDVLAVARPDRFAVAEAAVARAFEQTAHAYASLEQRLRTLDVAPSAR